MLEIDEEAKKTIQIDRVCILILRGDPQQQLPPKLGVRFCVSISIVERGRSSKNTRMPETSCQKPATMENSSKSMREDFPLNQGV